MEQARKDASKGVVVGMAALTGETRERKDIDTFIAEDEDGFNLLLLALSKMQNVPDALTKAEKDPATKSKMQQAPTKLGYFALAGIHGLPSTTWDSVDRVIRDAFGGYCAHGVLTFPIWHRPYLALFEQTIYLNMLVIIEDEFIPSLKSRYLAAAKRFRLPYYDYFRPRGGKIEFNGVVKDGKTSFDYDFRLADVFNVKKIRVVMPDGEVKDNFDNPLYTYRFSAESGEFTVEQDIKVASDFPKNETLRHPSDDTPDTHILGSLSKAVNSGREGRCSLSLDLMTTDPYNVMWNFATDAPSVEARKRENNHLIQGGDITKTKLSDETKVIRRDEIQKREISSETDVSNDAKGSIEGIHNNMHLIIGGSKGQMRNPQVAAFDPVFWFHHCEIDRLWALWQELHPNSWFPVPNDSSITADNKKKLYPFYKSATATGDDRFYNSDEARYTETFGYTYDDFNGLTKGDKDALLARIKGKYRWQIRVPTAPAIETIPVAMKPLVFSKTRFYVDPAQPAKKQTSQLMSRVAQVAESASLQAQAVIESATQTEEVDPKFDREWYIDSMVRRSAANGTFTIYFFLAEPGQLTDDPTLYGESPYLAALNHIFASSAELCDNCGQQAAAGQLATDTSPITPLLLDYLGRTDNELDSLRPEHVERFLIKNLRWRVVYGADDQQDPRDVPDLALGVSAKRYNNDGSITYEEYPNVIVEILSNASAAAGA